MSEAGAEAKHAGMQSFAVSGSGFLISHVLQTSQSTVLH